MEASEQKSKQYFRWCECDYPFAEMGAFFVYCKTCMGLIECEFCDDDKVLSTFEHLSYVTCKEHEESAIACAY